MNKDSKLLAEAYDKVGSNLTSPNDVTDVEEAYNLVKSGVWSVDDLETFIFNKVEQHQPTKHYE